MQAGDRIGRYVIQRRLAAGGMAEIFLAKLHGEAGFEKEIVLKRILPQWSADPDFVAMLIDEAKIAVQLNHPNIIQIYELTREDGVYYITMEYLRGMDLRRLLQKAGKKSVPVNVGLFVTTEILEGLAYAHDRKGAAGRPLHLIHRDISPQNILLSYAGEVKLTDFGIAKAASRSQETMTGVLKGKFAYMSPEQANQAPLDGRSDLYSLAIVLYELLTGERLFYRGSDIETLERVREGRYEFGAKGKAMPEDLKRILEQALAKRPDDRFANAAAFREALVEVAKKSGYDLSRQSMARYLASLFHEDFQEEGRNRQATTVLPQGSVGEGRTSLFVDNTRTAEVLARGIDPATDVTKSSLLSTRPPAAANRTVWIMAVVLVLVAFGVKYYGHLKNDQMAHNKSENELKIKESLEVKKPSNARPTPPEIPTPEPKVTANQVLPETNAESRPIAVETAPTPVVTLPPEEKAVPPPSMGYLSVQAIPWGVVTIDGKGGREAPLRRVPLAPGRHTVSVTYAPEKATASTAVTIFSSREIVCIAKLRGGKTIQCTK